MEFKIEKYNKTELLTYINSDVFKNAKLIPISPDRALSLINNPRIDNDDVILITASRGDRLMGYRTAMTDWIFNGNEKVKVAWICGSWVDPNYRRKGLATKLFIELNKSWNSALMYTNYAPASKKLYDKTNVFETYRSHVGKRFYLRFNTANVVPARFSWLKALRPLLLLLDKLANASLLHLLIEKKQPKDHSLTYPESLNEEQIKKIFKNTLSKRGTAEFEWIVNYPWVIDDSTKEGRDNKKYYFSWVSNPYRLYFVANNQGSENESVFMISIRGSQMKVLYYYSDEKHMDSIADIIFAEAQKNKVSEIDLFDEKLIALLMKNKANFIFSRAQKRKYMVSKHVIQKFPDLNAVKVPDGEGDVVFV